MSDTNSCLEAALHALRDSEGVITLKILSDSAKQDILSVEEEVEEKIAYGMCRTLNQGVREALQREHTVALAIDSSKYRYPHHSGMQMKYDETLVGEEVRDPDKITELKKTRTNFFLWDHFVIYTKLLPRDREEKKRIRIIYYPRPTPQLENLECIGQAVLGTPSSEGDVYLKKHLQCSDDDPLMGTCLIGFNIK